MEKVRYLTAGIVLGVLLGAGSALALSGGTTPQVQSSGTAWTEYHAAIPYEQPKEPAPTF